MVSNTCAVWRRNNLVEEHCFFLGGHGLEGRGLVVVFFTLGNVVAADEDVRKKRGIVETEKAFPTGVSWPVKCITVQQDRPASWTQIFFLLWYGLPIEQASPIYSPAF